MPIPVGPSTDDGYYYDPSIYWYGTDSSGSGSNSNEYSAQSVSTARVEKNTPKKTGPMLIVYSPDLAELFAGNV